MVLQFGLLWEAAESSAAVAAQRRLTRAELQAYCGNEDAALALVADAPKTPKPQGREYSINSIMSSDPRLFAIPDYEALAQTRFHKYANNYFNSGANDEVSLKT